MFFFFFFQAEDGIRDKLVTGVQTCALPISPRRSGAGRRNRRRSPQARWPGRRSFNRRASGTPAAPTAQHSPEYSLDGAFEPLPHGGRHAAATPPARTVAQGLG